MDDLSLELSNMNALYVRENIFDLNVLLIPACHICHDTFRNFMIVIAVDNYILRAK